MEAHKNKLIALKNAGGKSWTTALQDELDELILSEVDWQDQYEEVEKQLAELSAYGNDYDVPAGTEKMVHLSIVRGRRFNPTTGKEESKAYTQIFSVNEFNLFKINAHLLGYSVLKVLHDPTGEASKLVVK